MKTSNIIITAFAILITGVIVFLFADSKRHKEDVKNNINYKEFPLSDFNVIVAEKGSDVHIDRSDSTLIRVEYIKGVKVPLKLYEVINDTLHVYGGLRTFVKCKQITQIIGNKPFWVGLGDFIPDSLTIKMTGGQFMYKSDKDKVYTFNRKIYNINIIANDSANIEIGNTRLGKLNIKLNNATVNTYCEVKILNAKLINKAKINSVDGIGQISIEKDTSSRLQISKTLNYYN
jgi:hypothetical protein